MAVAKTRYISEYVIDTTRAIGPARNLDRVLGKTGRTSANVKKLLGGLGVGVGVSLIKNEVQAALGELVRFEDGLIGVGKTTNLTGADLEDFGEKIEALSRRNDGLGTSTSVLLAIAEAAGQVGVSGSADLLRYTDVLDKLAATTDIVGEEGARDLARLQNVTGESTDTVDKLGSVLVALGNRYAATERQILKHAGEIARATAVYEITSAEAAAVGTTLAAMGVQSELAGSAVGRSIRMLEDAVLSGGDQLESLARLSGVTAQEFHDAWVTGPIEAFLLFLRGLEKVRRSGGNVAQTLAEYGLKGEEILKVIPVLAKENLTLFESLRIAAEEVKNATALNEEALKAAESLSAEQRRLQQDIAAAQRDIAASLRGPYKALLVTLREVLSLTDKIAKAQEEVPKNLSNILVTPDDRAVEFYRRFPEEVQREIAGLLSLFGAVEEAQILLGTAAEESAEKIETVSEAQTDATISAEAMQKAGARVVRELRLEEEAAARAALELVDLAEVARQVKEAELAEEIEDQAQGWHELLGAMSPGIEVLRRLAAQQIKAEEAADRHTEALRRLKKEGEAAFERLVTLLGRLEDYRRLLKEVGGEGGPLPFDAQFFERSLPEDLSVDVEGALEKAAADGLTAGFEAGLEVMREAPSEFQMKMEQAGRFIANNWRDVIGQAVGDMLSVLLDDALKDSRPEGRFGGRNSSDFSDPFSQILGGAGSGLGALFGQAFGPLGSGIGSAIGGALGSVVGDLIGGAIKRGADHGIGELEQIGDDIAFRLERNEGGLGAVVQDIADGIAAGINDLERLLGGQINLDPGGGGGLGIKVADDKIKLFFAGQIHTFETIQEAVEAGIALIVRHGEVSEGTSPEVTQALQNFTGRTFEELEAALDLALRLEAERLGPVAAGVRDRVRSIVSDIFGALEAGISLDGGLAGLGRMKDEILGRQLTEEELLHRRAEAYNLEIDVLEANLKAKLAELEAQGQIVQHEVHLTRESLEAKGALVGGLGQLVGATGAAAEAIATISGILEQLDDFRINADDLADAASRIGSGTSQAQRQADQQRQQDARRELERLEALAAGNDERVAALEREARMLELVTAGLSEAEAARQLELEAILAGENARLSLEILEAQIRGDDSRVIALQRERRFAQLVASGLTEAEAARQLWLEGVLEGEAAAARAAEARRQLNVLEAQVAGDDERVAALEREARMTELLASGLTEAEAARRLELEAILASQEAVRNLEILEARHAGDTDRVDALEREARMAQLVASGLTEAQAARQLELEALLEADAARRELSRLEAEVAGDHERLEQLEREARIAELVAQGLSEEEAARLQELEAILATRDALRNLEILEARAAGDTERVEALEREARLNSLIAGGLTEVQALRQLELETQIEAAEAVAAASERARDAIQGPTGIAGQAAQLIDNITSLQQAIMDALGEELGSEASESGRRALEDLEALDAELRRQLEGLGEESLVGLGDRVLQLRLESQQTADDIRFLLENLEELGLTAEEVAAAVREGALPDLLAIGEAQAQRVGDEEALARMTEQRQRLELLFERIRFESMVATLQLAGALDEELQSLVLDVRRLFLLPDAPPTRSDADVSPSSSDVSQVARLRQELDGIIEASESAQLGPARREIEGIFETFARAGSLLRSVSASAEDWTRTARAMAAELADFWRGLVVDPAQQRLDALRQARQTPAQAFFEARQAFEDLGLGDLGGLDLGSLDPDQFAEIFDVLDRFQAAGETQFGESFGGTVVGRQIEAVLEQLIDQVPEEEDLMLLALEHLEQQTSERLDRIGDEVSLGGAIVTALTEGAVVAELRNLAEQVNDEAVAAGLEDLANALANGEIGLDDVELILAIDELRDQLDPGSPLELQLAGLIDQLTQGLDLNDVVIVGLDALRDVLDQGSPIHSQIGSLIDQLLAGEMTAGETLLALYDLRDQLDDDSPLKTELEALIRQYEEGVDLKDLTVIGLMELQQTLDEGSPLHSQIGSLIDQLLSGEGSTIDTITALNALIGQLDDDSPLRTQIEALVRQYEDGLDINDLTVIGLLDLQNALGEDSPLHSQLGSLIAQIRSGETSTAETIFALRGLAGQLDEDSPLKTQIEALIREYEQGLDINDLTLIGLQDLVNNLDPNSPLIGQIEMLIGQLQSGQQPTWQTIMGLRNLVNQLDEDSPLRNEIEALIEQYEAGLDVNDLTITQLQDLINNLDPDSPLIQEIEALITQLGLGEDSTANTIAALDNLRDQLDEGSPLQMEIDELISELVHGVAVDTGDLGQTLLDLAGLLGTEDGTAAELLRDIAEQLLNGELEIDDQLLANRLWDVLQSLGEDHPLHDVLSELWSTLGGDGTDVIDLLEGHEFQGVAWYTRLSWRTLENIELDVDRIRICWRRGATPRTAAAAP